MPGKSFSLPAHKSCPRAHGDICDNCYAEKGTYTFPSTINAQRVRFDWTVQSMRTPESMAAWVDHMAVAINALRTEYFRVHDSGDMFNAHYAECWYRVAVRCPSKKVWIPTRAWQIPNSVLPVLDPVMTWLRRLAALPNVTVRPSALNFGDDAPIVPRLHAGSTAANAAAWQCPAHLQGNECGQCRHCWDAKDEPVSYQRH
jgi:hypothetical protein